MSHYIIPNCEWCGAPIDFDRPDRGASKYCCRDCYEAAHSRQREYKKGVRNARRFAQNQMSQIETGILDKRMAEAKEKGVTYSEYKKQLTLAKVRNNG